MNLKKLLTLEYWNFEKVFLLLGLLVAIATLIYTAHPTFLFPEKVIYNEIRLDKTLLSQQYLIYFENVNKSNEFDKIESFEILDTGSKEKQAILKYSEKDNPERFIFVALTDPNNIIRFVSTPIDNENLINQLPYPALRRISLLNKVRIEIPTSTEFNMQGNWHLNVYLYNSGKELSLVVTRPLDFSPISSQSYIEELIFSIILAMVFLTIFPYIFGLLKSSKLDDSKHVSSVNIQSINATQPDVSNRGQELFEIQGIIVDVPKYGLIRRCNFCNRILENGLCREHGKVNSKSDLYIEAILFDGISEHVILVEREIIENLFKIDLEQSISIATEYLDASIIREMIKKQMVGRFFLIEGTYLVEGMKAKSIKTDSQISRMDLLSLFDRWKMTSKIN